MYITGKNLTILFFLDFSMSSPVSSHPLEITCKIKLPETQLISFLVHYNTGISTKVLKQQPQPHTDLPEVKSFIYSPSSNYKAIITKTSLIILNTITNDTYANLPIAGILEVDWSSKDGYLAIFERPCKIIIYHASSLHCYDVFQLIQLTPLSE